MPASESGSYAVCRDLHSGFDIDEKPKLFANEQAAQAFLQRQRIKDKPPPALQLLEWPQVAEYIERELKNKPSILAWLEWPLPVISISQTIFAAMPLNKWIQAEDIPSYDHRGTTTEEMVESGIRQLEHGQTPWPTCYLDMDWHFAEIEKKAWRLTGHVWEGSRSSFVVMVWKAVLDFDLLLTHVGRSVVVQSWQMHRHVVKVCAHLEMARSGTSSQERHHAEWTIRALLNAYGREMEAHGEIAAAQRTGPVETRPSTAEMGATDSAAEIARAPDPIAENTSSVAAVEKSTLEDVLITDEEASRLGRVDAFLQECNAEPNLETRIIRRHLHLALGHKGPRQFQYWQSNHKKTSQANDQEFERLLSKTPADFVKLLRRKNLL